MKPQKLFIISPLQKGYKVDTTNVSGNPIQSGHSSSKDAWQSVKSRIPANHVIHILDMGEAIQRHNESDRK
jgi:hypothetical protein